MMCYSVYYGYIFITVCPLHCTHIRNYAHLIANQNVGQLLVGHDAVMFCKQINSP